ncbi:hypothetical protein Y032_0041g484 [Ancylostoma ceylanicum]|uniref:Uncharacterized protein n=1 Tax=Ancylostoma ceylanicum TaxID=53326 RepID=A0A016UI95_9BILA|nr:hypothetical protein Y032_0041g484 [Ancylostoma ceylanicum]
MNECEELFGGLERELMSLHHFQASEDDVESEHINFVSHVLYVNNMVLVGLKTSQGLKQLANKVEVESSSADQEEQKIKN